MANSDEDSRWKPMNRQPARNSGTFSRIVKIPTGSTGNRTFIDLRQTCDATHAYGICGKEPVKGQRENHRTQRYNAIASQLLFQMDFPLIFVYSPGTWPYSRLICWSSESSSLTKAPAAGMARTR